MQSFRFTLAFLLVSASICLTILPKNALAQKVILTTPLDAEMKPLQFEKNAYAIEERWKENGTWKAKVKTRETGALLAEYGYADSTRNTLQGTYTLYSKNRKKLKETTYVNGMIDGPFTKWQPDGSLAITGNATGETLWGEVSLYNGSGKLKSTYNIDKQGNGTGVEYMTQTGITGEGAVKNSLQDGVWIYKDASGKKTMEVTYNDKGIEKEVCFDADGKPLENGQCISDRHAEFPGGAAAWKTFIEKNLKYPKESRRTEAQGVVFVRFIVKTDGSISNIKVLDAPDDNLAMEAVRVMQLSPKWTPAIEANKLVPYTHVQTINFQLK